jgi:hypothetical protein
MESRLTVVVWRADHGGRLLTLHWGGVIGAECGKDGVVLRLDGGTAIAVVGLE